MVESEMAAYARPITEADRLRRLEDAQRTAAIRACQIPRPTDLHKAVRHATLLDSPEGKAVGATMAALTALLTVGAVAATSPGVGGPSGALLGAIASMTLGPKLAGALRRRRVKRTLTHS